MVSITATTTYILPLLRIVSPIVVLATPSCARTATVTISTDKSVIKALKSGQLSALGIDVYEQEETLFFRDLSASIVEDDLITRLMSFQNVLITAHQGFFTVEAMDQIAETTLTNLQAFMSGEVLVNEVRIDS